MLVIARYSQDDWEVPSWEHKNNDDYLEVAMQGVMEFTGIDFFNYKEEYFSPLKHNISGNNVFVPYVIKGEETADKFKCWVMMSDGLPDCEDWEWVSIKDAESMLNPIQRNILKGIRV